MLSFHAVRTARGGRFGKDAVKPKLPLRHSSGAGEPLVLLHPFALCGDAWKPILPALERHHHVLIGTYPGHMGGDPLPDGFRLSISASVDIAEAEIDAAGFDKVHVVGNSLGGWFAIELARRGRALSMVAIAPAGGWESDSHEERRIQKTFKRMKRLLHIGGPLASILSRTRASRRMALRDVVAYPERLTPAQATLLMRAPWKCDVYNDVIDGIPHEPLPDLLHPNPCPMRLVWGTEDQILPIRGYSERWRRLIPGAEWVELEGLGHVPMFDDPDKVARSILDVTAPGRPSANAGSPTLRMDPSGRSSRPDASRR
jgi:pimeloyl-ACP methyl ester carboxylesterase